MKVVKGGTTIMRTPAAESTLIWSAHDHMMHDV
jgi:hypothetical protein